ncbi:MAG TPA: biopolymer transporter ExbD [Marinobacter sp.]|nr:biopolymer transporter ExbD [Marinobacter sp.]
MKTSRRARLRRRHYRRMNRPGGLNLVSLMDIFTILVFFLMVNSSDVKVMQNTTEVALPVSSSERDAVDNLTVQVSGQSILVQGREVARLDGIGADEIHIAGLSEELAYRRNRLSEVPPQGLEVTIMAGQGTEYRLLRRILKTCVDEQYRQVHLAVETGGQNG